MEADQALVGAKPEEHRRTVDDAADAFRDRLVERGRQLSYRQNCESMQRIHVSPALGKRRVDAVSPRTSSGSRSAMLAKGATPKTVRNVMTFLHSVFALAVENGLGVRRTRWPRSSAATAARRGRRPRSAVPDAAPSSTL